MFFPALVSSNRKDFRTHLVYADLLARQSAGLSASCSLTPLLEKDKLKNIESKTKLIELTKKSIDDELEIVKTVGEYSRASILWLPIKTYYLVYHQLCIIDYILTGETASLTMLHKNCVPLFSKRLLDKVLTFSNPLFNVVCNKSILNFKTVSGELLRLSPSDRRTYGLIMKKVVKDKISNKKIIEGLDERNKDDKAKVEKFRNSLSVSIFDFFYLMRLRLNYRNSDFIDDILARDTKIYFQRYHKASDNFYRCLHDLKNDLITRIPS